MNKFIESSKKERELMLTIFNKHNITDYSFTDEYSSLRYDGIFNKESKGTTRKIVFEVKNRKIDSNRYRTTVIEKSKYEFLIEFAKENDAEPFIFIFFTDGTYLAENLNKCNVTFSKKYCPKTTDGNNSMIEKELCEILITKENIYKL